MQNLYKHKIKGLNIKNKLNLKIMDITNYLIGLLTGVSVTTFFIGKEWYRYYTKYTIQQKQLDRVLKLNDKIKKLKTLGSTDVQNMNVTA